MEESTFYRYHDSLMVLILLACEELACDLQCMLESQDKESLAKAVLCCLKESNT